MAVIEKALALSKRDTSQRLGIIINGKAVAPGEFVPRTAAEDLPELAFAAARTGKKYIGISLDLDVPFKSLPLLGPIIHWMQHDLQADEHGVLTATTVPIANYVGPHPPRFAAPHRYLFYVYEQPEKFDPSKFRVAPEGQDYPVPKRMWYDADKFARESGVGEVLAANYFESK